MNTLFAWAIGGTELIIILVAVLILFGSKKIPEFARGLGQGIQESIARSNGRDSKCASGNAGTAGQIARRRPAARRAHRFPILQPAQSLTAGHFWHGRRPSIGAPQRG
jgi:TatA/E family protein of Tat protein translocase